MAHLKRYINRERGSKKERERGTEKGERGTEKGETVATHFQPILSTNILSFENRRVTTSLSLSLSFFLTRFQPALPRDVHNQRYPPLLRAARLKPLPTCKGVRALATTTIVACVSQRKSLRQVSCAERTFFTFS